MDHAFKDMLFFTSKLLKHLGNKDVTRVKDYLANLVVKYPNLDDCPVDSKLLKTGMDFIRNNYRINTGWKAGDGVFTVFTKLA